MVPIARHKGGVPAGGDIAFHLAVLRVQHGHRVHAGEGDEKLSTGGEKILLRDGLVIDVYSDDLNNKGEPDNLIASGIVERNASLGWAKGIKWCCRVDAQGIRHESDIEE